MRARRPRVAVVAGSDSSGGAGMAADIRTVFALGGHALPVLTSVTAQGRTGLSGRWDLPAEAVAGQLAAIIADAGVDVVKTGMLARAATVRAVADAVRTLGVPLVVDPVLAATSGAALLDDEAVQTLVVQLLPLACVVTPNLAEARRLAAVAAPGAASPTGGAETRSETRSEARSEMGPLAERLRATGARWALVTGGHLSPDEPAADLLAGPDGLTWLVGPRQQTPGARGTGCTLATALAVGLACGLDVPAAARQAKDYVAAALEHAEPQLGAPGLLDHAVWGVVRPGERS